MSHLMPNDDTRAPSHVKLFTEYNPTMLSKQKKKHTHKQTRAIISWWHKVTLQYVSRSREEGECKRIIKWSLNEQSSSAQSVCSEWSEGERERGRGNIIYDGKFERFFLHRPIAPSSFWYPTEVVFPRSDFFYYIVYRYMARCGWRNLQKLWFEFTVFFQDYNTIR